MPFDFLTLDDFDTSGKTVFVRVDINSPLDPISKRILDDTRIKAIVDTLKDLKNARVVLGAHQSRPGKYDFGPLELHARVLQMYMNGGVSYVTDIIGDEATKSIEALKPGDILLLENLRFLPEENRQASPEQLIETEFVKKLAPYFDLVVNDAFAAAHRSQPSLVGLGEVLPMVAGRLMESELKAIDQVLIDPARPCVFVLGGVKVEDRIPAMRRVLGEEIADRVLVGGLVRETFHIAEKHPRHEIEALSDAEKKLVAEADILLEKYGDKIEIPLDVALDVGGERVEIHIDSVTNEKNIFDIGLNTLAHFCNEIRKAGTVVAEGPMGMFERRYFDTGTKEILRAMADCEGFTLVGGGHLGAMATMMDLDSRMSHVSTGGGAMLTLLAGDTMPVVEALERSKMRFS